MVFICPVFVKLFCTLKLFWPLANSKYFRGLCWPGASVKTGDVQTSDTIWHPQTSPIVLVSPTVSRNQCCFQLCAVLIFTGLTKTWPNRSFVWLFSALACRVQSDRLHVGRSSHNATIALPMQCRWSNF